MSYIAFITKVITQTHAFSLKKEDERQNLNNNNHYNCTR